MKGIELVGSAQAHTRSLTPNPLTSETMPGTPHPPLSLYCKAVGVADLKQPPSLTHTEVNWDVLLTICWSCVCCCLAGMASWQLPSDLWRRTWMCPWLDAPSWSQEPTVALGRLLPWRLLRKVTSSSVEQQLYEHNYMCRDTDDDDELKVSLLTDRDRHVHRVRVAWLSCVQSQECIVVYFNTVTLWKHKELNIHAELWSIFQLLLIIRN